MDTERIHSPWHPKLVFFGRCAKAQVKIVENLNKTHQNTTWKQWKPPAFFPLQASSMPSVPHGPCYLVAPWWSSNGPGPAPAQPSRWGCGSANTNWERLGIRDIRGWQHTNGLKINGKNKNNWLSWCIIIVSKWPVYPGIPKCSINQVVLVCIEHVCFRMCVT